MELRYALLNADKSLRFTADVMEWARMFEGIERFVEQTSLDKSLHNVCQWEHSGSISGDRIDKVFISTTFLGLDHSYTEGKSLWFETMIFGGKEDGYQDRCETWLQAKDMHGKAVMRVINGRDYRNDFGKDTVSAMRGLYGRRGWFSCFMRGVRYPRSYR